MLLRGRLGEKFCPSAKFSLILPLGCVDVHDVTAVTATVQHIIKESDISDDTPTGHIMNDTTNKVLAAALSFKPSLETVAQEREVAAVIPFAEARQRAKMLRLKRSIADGSYQPDISKLAQVLLHHDDFLLSE